MTTSDAHLLDAVPATAPALDFAEHHHELRMHAERLLGRAQTVDYPELVADYRVFERAVLRHMMNEEELLLPGFEEREPAEAATIRRSHLELRKQLYQTGIDAELHHLRVESLRKLIAQLSHHAAYEERTLYPWAVVHLPSPARVSLLERLAMRFRDLADRV